MNPLNILSAIVWTVALSVAGIALGLLFMGLDRILLARMQARIGPPLRQPWWDTIKLMHKQNIVPAHAIPWLFNMAPVAALAASITMLLYIPVAGFAAVFNAYGDLILVMYLLAVPALAMTAGGLASGSPYATIGAQREMVTMISYELPLATTVVAFGWKLSDLGLAHPFSLATISQCPIWTLVGPIGFVGCGLLLICMLLVTPGELGRIPFDAPEAETEIAGGLIVEYSGRNLALIYLAMGVKTVVMCALMVALFFPWNFSAFVSLPCFLAPVADLLFYLAKLVAVMFFSVTLVRGAVARFRITQVVDVYWKFLGAMALLGMVLMMADALIMR